MPVTDEALEMRGPRRDTRPLRVVAPSEPPRLNPRAAVVLLRLLGKAAKGTTHTAAGQPATGRPVTWEPQDRRAA